MALTGTVYAPGLLDENWDLPWRKRGPPMDWRTGQVGGGLQNQQPTTLPQMVDRGLTGLLGEDGQTQAMKRVLGIASELTALPSAYRMGEHAAKSEPGNAILEGLLATAAPLKGAALIAGGIKGVKGGGKALDALISPKLLARKQAKQAATTTKKAKVAAAVQASRNPAAAAEKKAQQTAVNQASLRERVPTTAEGLFDVSELEKVPDVPQRDLPRYEPPRGVSQRILDLTGNRNVRDQMLDIIQRGVGAGGKRWYNAEPLRQEFIAELGADEGEQAFRRFMEYVSATSPRSKVTENVRNASYYYKLERQGKPMPQVGKKNPKPYGHMAQRLHQMNAQRVNTGGIDPLNNPKPPSFSENLSGNQLPATVDAHAFKLPAILMQDPRFLQTSFKAGKGIKAENVRAKVEKGLLNIGDVPAAQWEGQPKANEYLAMERYYKSLADELGITPAQAQSSGWQAGGDITGLGSSSTEAFIETLRDRVIRTAKAYQMDPRDVLRKMIRGDMSLLGIAGLGGLLGSVGDRQDDTREGT